MRLAIVLAQLTDLLTFICVASVLPIEGEINPLMRFAFVTGGFLGVTLLKAAGTVGVLLILSRISVQRQALATGLFVAIPLIGALMNTLAVALIA